MGFPFYKILFGSLALMISDYTEKYRKEDYDKFLNTAKNPLFYDSKEYDFIVVGAGSAGGVVAHKLSARYSVLLLEHGGDPVPQMDIPIYWPFTFRNLDVVHEWTSVKQKSFGLQFDGYVPIQQGKGMGGSSAVNYMIYNRGHPEDYNLWANITGDDSWSYKNVLKHFKASETFVGETNDHLGANGLMSVTAVETGFNDEEQRWMDQLMKGAQELGYRGYLNANGPQTEGFSVSHKSIRRGKRSSIWNAFLKPFQDRETLKISRYSIAEKVVFDDNNKAIGVLYKRHGIDMYAKARKEVILSAGSFNSPHILMHSGIGPHDQLKKAGIPCRLNRPVGQFYQDHPILPMKHVTFNQEAYPNAGIEEIDNYLKYGKGPIANVLQNFGQAFLTSEESKKNGEDNWPDYEFVCSFESQAMLNFSNNFIVYVLLGRPSSVGKVVLNPKNPAGQLIWDPNQVSTERDKKIAIEGVKMAIKLTETEAFDEIGIKIDRKPIEPCKQFDFGSDEYAECWFRYGTLLAWHPVGTCKMGRESDPTAVVDPELRVIGARGLRVIDNSIQPAIVNSNTNAAAIMIGQKGAEMILNEYKYHKN